MSRSPSITVVTIVRNDLQGIERTVTSVQMQTFENLEHIVVDGASADGTRQWLLENAGSVRGVAISEPDDGIYDAMNKGLGRATGELTVFMNAGDRFPDPQTLEVVAENWRAKQWAWAYGGVRWMKSGLPVSDVFQTPYSNKRFALGRMWIPHQSAYVNTALMQGLGGFRPEYGVGADQELLLRVSRVAPPEVIDRVLSEFELGGAHSTQTLLQRELAWRRMRLASYGPVPADLPRTVIRGVYLTARHQIGRRVRARSRIDA